jgi:hypothetical protein
VLPIRLMVRRGTGGGHVGCWLVGFPDLEVWLTHTQEVFIHKHPVLFVILVVSLSK